MSYVRSSMNKDSNQTGSKFGNSAFARLRSVFVGRSLSCVGVERLISLAADSQATQAEISEIEAHVATCAECRELQSTSALCGLEIRQRPRAIMPSDLPGRLIEAIARERDREIDSALRSRRRLWSNWNPRVILPIGAIAAASCVAGMVFLIHPHSPQIMGPGAPIAGVSKPDRVAATFPEGLPARTKSYSGIHRNTVAVNTMTVASASIQPHPTQGFALESIQRSKSMPRRLNTAGTVPSAVVKVASLPHPSDSSTHFAVRPAVRATTPIEEATLPVISDRAPIVPAPSAPAAAQPSSVAAGPATTVASLPEPSAPATVTTAAFQPDSNLRSLVSRLSGRKVNATVSVASTGPRMYYTSSESIVSAPFN